MSLVSSMLQGFRGIRAEISGAPAPWDDFWYNPVGSSSVSGMRVSPESAKRLGVVVACVSLKARSIGVLPCFLMTDLPGGGKQIVRQHPLFKILHKQPNDLQTAMEFYEMLEGHLELRGNGYAEILTDSKGVIGELMPMHPDHVKVEVLSSGNVRYVYNDPLTNSTRVLLQEEVFHLREWCDKPYVGQSRVEMGRDLLGVALAQQDYVGKYLKNDATSGLIITGTHFESKADEEEYQREFLRSTTGENRHRVKLLPPGVDVKSLSVKPEDMQLLESTNASDAKICSLFNVLPDMVGIDTGKASTYASVEQRNLMHAQKCVLPMAVRWEQAIGRDLIDDDRFYAKFSLASLMRADYATRMAGYAVAIEHGWLSQDDVRELEDLNPIAGGIGKKYWRALNWTTLDAPIATQKATAPAGDGGLEEEVTTDDGQITDPSGSADAGMRAQLVLLAQDNASRCARRESGALRKLIDQEASEGEIRAFYAEHFKFVCDAFHFGPLQTLNFKKTCDERANHLAMLLGTEETGQARQWVERVASSESATLSNLAVQGVL
jgi:HK97 family phage portal protein